MAKGQKGTKMAKCGHVIKQILMLLWCSTILFDRPEIKPQQSKIIPYELVNIPGNIATIILRRNVRINGIFENPSTTKIMYYELQLERICNVLWQMVLVMARQILMASIFE